MTEVREFVCGSKKAGKQRPYRICIERATVVSIYTLVSGTDAHSQARDHTQGKVL
jgi:hypothetical protein